MNLKSFKQHITERNLDDLDLEADGWYVVVNRNLVAYLKVKNGKMKVLKQMRIKGMPFRTDKPDLIFKIG